MGNALPGVGSGLDIRLIVETLVNSEIEPKKHSLDKRGLSISTNLSAYGQVKASLAKLKDSIRNLSCLDKVFSIKGSMSDSDHFNITTYAQALPGTHTIQVNQLAQKHTVVSPIFANSTTSIGSGNINIQFGTYSTDLSTFTQNFDVQTMSINIADENSSLQQIADAINATKSQVQASIIQDSQGYRLTLSSSSTGEKYAMKISVTDNDGNYNELNGLNALNYDPTIASHAKMTQSIAAQNSMVTIDSIVVLGENNSLKDAISGVTLDLKKQHTGTDNTILTLDNDKSALMGNLKEFVRQYNESIALLNTLTKTSKDVRERGHMASDTGLKTMKFKLNNWATDRLDNTDSSIQTLSAMGIKMDSKGQLVLDESVLQKTMDNNYQDLGNFLAEKEPLSASTLDGVMLKLDKIVKGWVDPQGELDTKTKQYESYMKKLNVEYEALDIRIESLERRYFRQYNALDALIAKMQGITTNLTMQMNSFANNK